MPITQLAICDRVLTGSQIDIRIWLTVVSHTFEYHLSDTLVYHSSPKPDWAFHWHSTGIVEATGWGWRGGWRVSIRGTLGLFGCFVYWWTGGKWRMRKKTSRLFLLNVEPLTPDWTKGIWVMLWHNLVNLCHSHRGRAEQRRGLSVRVHVCRVSSPREPGNWGPVMKNIQEQMITIEKKCV